MPINKAVSLIITTRFEELCLAGHFPEVEFKKGVVSGMNMVSYSGMPYTEYRTRLATLVHLQMEAAGYQGGIFATRLRSKAYLSAAKSFADRTTNVEIRALTRRLRSWAD